MRNKMIQLPERFFCLTMLLIHRLEALEALEHDQATKSTLDELKTLIDAKIDAKTRHDLYTQSKTAPTDEERELARQKYLDAAGIHKDWRW